MWHVDVDKQSLAYASMTVSQILILYTLYAKLYDTTNLTAAFGSRDLRLVFPVIIQTRFKTVSSIGRLKTLSSWRLRVLFLRILAAEIKFVGKSFFVTHDCG